MTLGRALFIALIVIMLAATLWPIIARSQPIAETNVRVTAEVSPEMNVVANCWPGEENTPDCIRALQELEAAGGVMLDDNMEKVVH